jgi:lambda family phage portal protein
MKATWLDKAVLWVSPQRGARRLAHRANAEMMMSAYDGASGSPRNASRRYRGGDANSAVRSGAKRLRYAARDLERNNPLASRGFAVLTSNVIGAGIIPAVNVPKAGTGKRSSAVRDGLQDVVNAHCDTAMIDVVGQQNLYGLQKTAFHAAVRDGESLMVRRRARSSEQLPLPFQIAVLEADYFDDRVHGQQPNGNIAIDGVEFSPRGAAVAYHLYDRHPGDSVVSATLKSTRYEAADVVHLYRIDRPGQAHGVSWVAPVIVRLGDFEDTKDAYILRQKIAACFSAFVTKTDPAGMPTNTSDKTRSGTQLETVEPGMIEYLGPGEKVEFGAPPVVGDLEAFFRVNGRDIAVGLGITYEALTGDLSNVNFSSGRMGWLELYRNIADWTGNMVQPQLCDKVGGWILEGPA